MEADINNKAGHNNREEDINNNNKWEEVIIINKEEGEGDTVVGINNKCKCKEGFNKEEGILREEEEEGIIPCMWIIRRISGVLPMDLPLVMAVGGMDRMNKVSWLLRSGTAVSLVLAAASAAVAHLPRGHVEDMDMDQRMDPPATGEVGVHTDLLPPFVVSDSALVGEGMNPLIRVRPLGMAFIDPGRLVGLEGMGMGEGKGVMRVQG